jgi:hypothetical protein
MCGSVRPRNWADFAAGFAEAELSAAELSGEVVMACLSGWGGRYGRL